MALGIVWGMASVMVLLAVANGFESSQRNSLEAYGDRFVLLRLNRAELDRAGSTGKERRLQMDEYDLERLRQGAPAIRHFTPMNYAYRVRVTGRTGTATSVFIAGALPEITRIRNLPLEEGRFFNEIDNENRRRVIVLGPMVRKQLFGTGPAVGRTVRISGFSTAMVPARTQPVPKQEASVRGASQPPGMTRPGGSSSSSSSSSSRSSSSSSSSPSSSSTTRGATAPLLGRPSDDEGPPGSEVFEVIGVLKDVETQRESYASTARLAFIPFATSMVVYDKDFGTMLIEPRTVEDKHLALRQFREVMGYRYGFKPDDRNAVVIYFDSIERARSIGAIFGGVRLFLVALGVLILAVGGIGVMNVVLVSVAARTFEIGLRKSLGATPRVIYSQFFLETMLACFLSGLLGFAIGAAGIQLLSGLPLPEGFSRPVLDVRTTLLSFGILTAIAVIVGVYPARRAALLPPVEALKGRA